MTQRSSATRSTRCPIQSAITINHRIIGSEQKTTGPRRARSSRLMLYNIAYNKERNIRDRSGGGVVTHTHQAEFDLIECDEVWRMRSREMIIEADATTMNEKKKIGSSVF